MNELATIGAVATGIFCPRDGVELFERSWSVPSPKACVLIVHGYGEHCTRYGHVAERFNEEGFSVFAYDQRSHGESPGKKGTVSSIELLSDDLAEFLENVRGRVGDTPVFIFGHSMGGLVLALFAIRHTPEIRGLLFSSAALESAKISRILRLASSILARFLPEFPVRELDVTGLSRIPEVVNRYTSDPLVYHGKIGARTGRAMMKAIDFVGEHFEDIVLPFIAQHGTGDRIVPPAASELLFERAASKDKFLKLYDGAYHEVFNDLGSETFLNDSMDWIKARL